jgi:hypothetical protein
MDISKLFHAYIEQVLVTEVRKAKETDALMSEIEAFHFQTALNKSLDERDQVSFLKLTEMGANKCLLN